MNRSKLLLTYLKNIIEKKPGSKLRFYIDMDFIAQYNRINSDHSLLGQCGDRIIRCAK